MNTLSINYSHIFNFFKLFRKVWPERSPGSCYEGQHHDKKIVITVFISLTLDKELYKDNCLLKYECLETMTGFVKLKECMCHWVIHNSLHFHKVITLEHLIGHVWFVRSNTHSGGLITWRHYCLLPTVIL